MRLTSGLIEEKERVSRREGGTGKQSPQDKKKGGRREEVVIRCRVGG
jgi:hypothetical protein